MEREKELNKRDLWSVLVLAGLVTVFFSQVLFTDKSFVFRDYYRYFYPTRYFAWESIRDGIIPLWNPYLYSGIPFLADLQSCVFYPPSIILYLLPFHFGLKFFVVFHFFLAGLFMYLLLRDFKLNRSACLAGAITFTFSGYLLSVLDMITSLTSAVWIPLVFLFFNRALNSKIRNSKFEIRNTVLTGVILGVQFLGGEPTVLYGTLMALFFFAIAKAVARSTEHGARRRLSLLIAHCSLLIATGVIALGLTLFQALPFLEIVGHSTRAQGMGYATASYWSMAPYELFNLFAPLPSIFGVYRPSYLVFLQAWLKNPYLGIIPLLLAVFAITYIKNRRVVLFFGSLLFGFVILSFGNYIPSYRFLYEHLPLFSLIRYPVKFFSISTFALAILAGFGFHYLTKNLKGNRMDYLKPFLVFNILYLVGWIFAYGYRGKILKILVTIYFPNLSSEQIFGLSAGYLEFMQNVYFVGIILSIAGLLVYLTKNNRLKPKTTTWALIILIIADLFYFGMGLNPLIGKEFYNLSPRSLEIVREPGSLHRLMVTPRTNEYYKYLHGPSLAVALETAKTALIPNLGLRYHLFEVGGYCSLILNDYVGFLRFLEHKDLKGALPVLNLLNVRYLISHWRMEEKGLDLVYNQGINIYENPTPLPRAFLVPEAVIIKDRGKILERLFDPKFDPTREVILEEGGRGQGSGIRGQKSEDRRQKSEESRILKSAIRNPQSVIVVEYQPNKVVIKTSSEEPGFLFLSDTYFPGWTAYVDGVKTKVYRANYTFRAIEFPAGGHRVEFVYRPLSFRIGIIGTIITFISLLGWGLAKRELFAKFGLLWYNNR